MFVNDKSPHYEGPNDLDRNEFLLEGFVNKLYTPANNALTFLEIECLNELTGVKNFPQVKVFRSQNHILKGIKEKDYIRVKGHVYSQTRKTEDGIKYFESVYSIHSAHKVAPPTQKKDAFLERFGMFSDGTLQKKRNYIIASGVVSQVNIRGKNGKNGIQFKITSHWGKKQENTLAITYYTDNLEDAFNCIYNGNRILILGEIHTRRIVVPGKKTYYAQEIIANDIGSFEGGK